MNQLTPWQVIDNAIAEYKRITWLDKRKESTIVKVDIKESKK